MNAIARAVLLSTLLFSVPAFAGLGSLLAKLGKAGSSGAKAGRALSVGAKAAKAARLAKVGVGITGLVATERAGLALAHLSDDAARGAVYLARSGEGEVLLVSRAAGQSTHSATSAGIAIDAMGANGKAPLVMLDKSAAASPEVVAALPENASLVLVEDGHTLPLRRAPEGHGDLIVDTADGAMNVADYLAPGGDDEDSGSSMIWIVAIVLVGGVLLFKVMKGLAGTSAA